MTTVRKGRRVVRFNSPDPRYRNSSGQIKHYSDLLGDAVAGGQITEEQAKEAERTYRQAASGLSYTRYNPLEDTYESVLPEWEVTAKAPQKRTWSSELSPNDPEYQRYRANHYIQGQNFGKEVAATLDKYAPYAALAPLAGIAPVFLGASAELAPLAVNGAKDMASFLGTQAGKQVALNTGKTLLGSMIAGEGVNTLSHAMTGKSFGGNVADATNYVPLLNKVNYGVRSTVGDFLNPGYFVGGRMLTPAMDYTANLMGKGADAAGQLASNAVDVANNATNKFILGGRKQLLENRGWAKAINPTTLDWASRFGTRFNMDPNVLNSINQAKRLLEYTTNPEYVQQGLTFKPGVIKQNLFNRITQPLINERVGFADLAERAASGYQYPFAGTKAGEEYTDQVLPYLSKVATKLRKAYNGVGSTPEGVDFDLGSGFTRLETFNPDGSTGLEFLKNGSGKNRTGLATLDRISIEDPKSLTYDVMSNGVPQKATFSVDSPASVSTEIGSPNRAGFHTNLIPTHTRASDWISVSTPETGVVKLHPSGPEMQEIKNLGMGSSPTMMGAKALKSALPKYTFISSSNFPEAWSERLMRNAQGKLGDETTSNIRKLARDFRNETYSNMDNASLSPANGEYSGSSLVTSVQEGSNPNPEKGQKLRYTNEYFTRVNSLGIGRDPFATIHAGDMPTETSERFLKALNTANDMNSRFKWDWHKSHPFLTNLKNMLDRYVQGPVITADNKLAYPFPTVMTTSEPVINYPEKAQSALDFLERASQRQARNYFGQWKNAWPELNDPAAAIKRAVSPSAVGGSQSVNPDALPQLPSTITIPNTPSVIDPASLRFSETAQEAVERLMPDGRLATGLNDVNGNFHEFSELPEDLQSRIADSYFSGTEPAQTTASPRANEVILSFANNTPSQAADVLQDANPAPRRHRRRLGESRGIPVTNTSYNIPEGARIETRIIGGRRVQGIVDSDGNFRPIQ